MLPVVPFNTSYLSPALPGSGSSCWRLGQVLVEGFAGKKAWKVVGGAPLLGGPRAVG